MEHRTKTTIDQSIHSPSSRALNVAIVTITSRDPVEMYWRLVFYGAAEPDAEFSIVLDDGASGLSILRLCME